MTGTKTSAEIAVRLYEPEDWTGLWRLHIEQLIEEGIDLDENDIPSRTSAEDAQEAKKYNEEDLFYVEAYYLQGGGGYWLAWDGEKVVGSVGGQDLSGVVELRRMYVAPEYRQRGIGARLVGSLIEHCTAKGIHTIELWTDPDGLGKFLYKKMGFRLVERKGTGFEAAQDRPKEIRMRLDLNPGDNPMEVE